MLHVSVALTTVIPLFAGLNPWISSQRALLRTLPPSDGTCPMPESGRSAARHLARAHSVRGVAYAAGKPHAKRSAWQCAAPGSTTSSAATHDPRW